jgi:hypothetical protein
MSRIPELHGVRCGRRGRRVRGLFDTREGAIDANEKVSTWVRGSLVDFINGEPDIIVGEVLASVTP